MTKSDHQVRSAPTALQGLDPEADGPWVGLTGTAGPTWLSPNFHWDD